MASTNLVETYAEQVKYQTARVIGARDLLENGERRIEELYEQEAAMREKREFLRKAISEAPKMLEQAQEQLARLKKAKELRDARGNGRAYGKSELTKRLEKQDKLTSKMVALQKQLEELRDENGELPPAVAEVLNSLKH